MKIAAKNRHFSTFFHILEFKKMLAPTLSLSRSLVNFLSLNSFLGESQPRETKKQDEVDDKVLKSMDQWARVYSTSY